MSRISIDVTLEEHKKLKAMAALQGKTIKDYVLERALIDPAGDEVEALAQLEALLDSRIDHAIKEGPSKRSVGEIFDQARKEAELS